MPPQEHERRAWLAPLALTLLALLLRGLRLAEPSLWIDETLSMTDAWNALAPSSPYAAPNYPLSYALIRLGLELAGWNEFGARLLPCAIGVLTVPLLYLWVRARWSREGALWSALLLALSPWHLLQSQNARYYTLLTLFALSFAMAAARLVERGRWRDLGATLLCLTLGILTHPAAAFSVLAVPALWLVERRRAGHPGSGGRRARWIWVGLALAALVAAPFFADVLRPHFTSKAGFSFVLHLTSLVWHAGIAFLALATGGVLLAARRGAPFAVLVSLHVASILATATLASFFVRVNQQYVVATLPFACVLVAHVIVEVRRRAGPWLAGILAFAVLAEQITTDFLYHGPLHGFRARWREASELVAREWRPGDLIASNRPTILEVYLNPTHRDLRDGRLVLGLSRWNRDVLTELMQRSSRVWYVVEDEDLVEWRDRDPESFRAYLARRCRLVADYPLALGPKDLTVKVYLHEGGSTTFE